MINCLPLICNGTLMKHKQQFHTRDIHCYYIYMHMYNKCKIMILNTANKADNSHTQTHTFTCEHIVDIYIFCIVNIYYYFRLAQNY